MKKSIAFILAVIMMLALLPAGLPVFAISPADAVVNIDFAGGIPDGMVVAGAALVNDPVKGQVMSFDGSAGGVNGSASKAELPMASLAETDFSKGISWTVWVKGTAGTHGMHPIFNIDLTRIGYLALLADLVVTANSDGNETSWGIERVWSDPPNPLEEEVSLIGEEWLYLTVVISEKGVSLYKNGKLYETDPWAQGSFGIIPEVMLEQMAYATGITLGAYKCDWWRFGDFSGFISSAALYNKTLSADEIKELFVNSGGIYAEDPTEASTPAPVQTPARQDDAGGEPAAEEIQEKTTAPNASGDSGSGWDNTIIIVIAAAAAAVIILIAVIAVKGKGKGKKK